MGLFRKRKDRSYSVKLRRQAYAKLGLLSERLKTSESDTLEGCIDFSLASFTGGAKASTPNLDIASLISGEASPDSDLVTQLITAFLPKLMQGGIGPASPSGGQSSNQPANSSENVDVSKALKDLGL